MNRFGLGRLLAVLCLLVLGVFAVGVTTASATHFRYGSARWEKVLTHNVAGEYKFRVTFEGGWRWSFPYGGVSANQCGTIPGFVATGSTGTGSCSPLGTAVNVGTIEARNAANQLVVVKFNGTTNASSLAYNGIITSILADQDQMFTSFSFDVIVPVSAGPVSFVYTNSARVSQLLDGNGDQAWRVAVTTNGDPAYGTRSPRSVSLATIPVAVGINNTFPLPNISYDGFTNRFRLSTSAESSLVATTPVAPSVFSLDATTGVVSFVPRVAGLYAVQFQIVSYDANGIARNSIPVDLTFNATTPVAGAPTVLLTGPATATFTPGTAGSFQLQSVMSPPTAGWTSTIVASPVPITPAIGQTGAAKFTVPAGTGLNTTTGTLNWTPTLASGPDVMCFQAIYRNATTTVVSPGQKCVNLSLGEMETSLSAVAISGAPYFVGQHPTLSATLLRTADSAPVVQRSVTFTVYGPDGTWNYYTGVTNVSGVASANITLPKAGAYTFQVNFAGVEDELRGAVVAGPAFTVQAATGAVFPSAPAASNPTSYFPTALSVQMYVNPANLPSPAGQAVDFVVTSALGVQSTVTGITDGTGIATALFVPPTDGLYTMFARFNGSADVTGTATSATSTFTPRQRMQLDLQFGAAVAGANTPVSVLLTRTPQATPVAGRSVNVTIPGGFPSTLTLTTDGQGAASGTTKFTDAGIFNPSASSVLQAGEVNSVGGGSLMTGLNLTVAKAATTLAIVTVPVGSQGQASVTATTTLSRTSAPAGVIAGSVVTFTLTNPNNVTTQLAATTNASGVASVTFPASNLPILGVYSIVASYAGSTALEAAQSPFMSFGATNLTPTTLTMSPVNAVVGIAQAISATLTTYPLPGTPIAGRTVTFTYNNGISLGSATTNASGVATVNATLATAGSFTVTASFPGTVGQYANESGGTPTIRNASLTVTKQLTALSAPTATPATVLVGQSITGSTTLTRVSPAAQLPGKLVIFTMTDPGGSVQQPAATTSAAGVASASFATLVRGNHLLKAEYTGSTTEEATVSAITAIPVYERTSLVLGSASGSGGSPVSLSAQLRTAPANLPIAGQTVTFSFGSSGLPTQTATTNASGIATTIATFPSGGTFAVTASFLNPADFFVDASGAVAATTSTANAVITASPTSLTTVSVPATAFVGGSVSASSTLTRTDGTPVPGASVSFTFGGAASASLTATTNAAGLASVTLPVNVKGGYTVSAAFAAASGLLASSTGQSSFTVSQQTQLTLAPITGVAGSSANVGATLIAIPSGAPISGQLVTFDFAGVIAPQTAVTNSLGVASISVTFANPGTAAVTATFSNAAGFFVSSTDSQPASISAAASALSPLTVVSASVVGDALSVSTVLTRTSTPAGPIQGASVTFTLSGPSNASLTATTDASGLASVSFPIATRGAYTVSAVYAGTAAVNATASNTASVTVYQRTQLSLGSVSGVAGVPVSLSASLATLPSGATLSGQLVSFDVQGLPTETATTDASGIATVSVTPTVSGSLTATATFSNAAGFFTNAAGVIPSAPTTATAAVTVAKAATQLSLTAPAQGLVGDSLTASATLTRNGSTPAAGESVLFTLGGTPTATLSAVTNAAGIATVSFPLADRGSFTVSASFAGNAALNASTSSTSPVTVNQRTQLTLAPVTGTAGAATMLSATLTATPGGAPLAGQVVTFSTIPSAGTFVATTNSSGVASVSGTFAEAASYSVTASFSNAPGFFVQSSGTESATIVSAASSLAPLTVANASLVGNTLNVSSVLMRTSAPSGPISGSPVTFTLTDPQSNVTSLTGNTDATGAVSVSFPVLARGTYTVQASYAGTAGTTGTVSNVAPVTVYQRTQLSLGSTSATAGVPTSLSATLTAAPAGTPVSGQAISFTIDGLTTQTATTNASGVATVVITPTVGGVLNATAAFLNPAAFYTDAAGAIPPAATTASGTVTVAKAATELSLSAPPQALVGNTLTVSAALTRNGSMPAAGETVAFTLTGPSTSTLIATTNGAGVASVSFPLSQRGAFTLTANFAGTAALNATTSATAFMTVFQRTQLTLAPATGNAASPISVTATLTTVPGGTPIAGQTVTLGTPSNGFSTTAVTDANGVATASTTFATAGTYPATASFINGGDFYVDAAGVLVATTAAGSVTVTDPTPPVVTASINGPLGLGGWYTRDVAVTWTVTDAESAVTSQTGCGSQTVSADGTVTFTCEATSDGGTTTETVTVKRDATAPVITVPANQTLEATSAAGSIASYAAATAIDPTSGLAQISCAPASGSMFALGATEIVCTAKDEAGNQSNDSFGITVVDTTAPAIDTAANITTSATSANGAAVSYTSPAWHDLVDGLGTTACVPPSGSIFPLGQSTVVCTATDARGNSASRTFTVTVTNNAPTFTAPANITTSATSPAGAVVDFAAAGQDVEEGTIAAVCAPASHSTFPLGSTTVNCTVTDVAGAAATGSFSVTVTNQAPTVTVPSNISTSATSALGAIVSFTATAADLEDGVLTPACAPVSGSTFAIGTTTVSCAVTDVAGATTTNAFTVTVTNNAPSFTAPSSISMAATSPAGALVDFTANGQDVEDGVVAAVCAPASHSTFPLGSTTVNCTVTDVVGAQATGSFSVTVTNQAPAVTVPSNISVSAMSASGASVNFTANAADFEDGVLTPACAPVSGSTFAIGTTTVSCSVTDVAGAIDTKTFTVTVTNNAPTFTAPANITKPATGAAGAIATFSAPGQDIEDGALNATCTPASGSTFALGATTVNCTVTDVAGATASGSFTVTVTNNAPTVTVPSPISRAATGPNGAVVTFTATAGDIEDGALTPVCTPASGATFPLGATTVSCKATDSAGATATNTFTVTVTNNAPTFTPPANITKVATGPAGAIVSFTAIGQDLEDGPVGAVCSPASGSTFPLGTTTVSCLVRDVVGASVTGSFTVRVTNNIPTFTPPANITVTASGPSTAPVSFIAIGNDLDQGPIPAVCSRISGSEFAVGTTTVTCTVTDIVGATVGASFTVTVKAANTAAFLIRHAPVVNGGTMVTGSMRVMLPENVTFNGGTVTGDLLIPGTPQLTRNGQTTLGGTVDGSGAAAPTTHRITMNGGTSLSRIVRRTDGFVLNTVASPATPTGTRSVSLNNASDQIGSWSTLRDLTLNGNIGSVIVAGGTYGSFTANGSNKLVLGVAGSTTPTVYNFQSLVLNGSSSIEVVGPVVVTVKNALSLNGSVNSTNNPEWLTLKVATGGVTLNGNIAVRGFIEAPTGTVTINGNSSITGRVIADGLTLNGSAKLTLVQ